MTKITPRFTKPVFLTGVLATVIAGALGFILHVSLFNRLQPIIEASVKTAHIAQPPYSPMINFFAAATMLLPVAVSVVIYYWLGHYVPGKSRIIKGLWFGIIIAFMKGGVIRQPIMDSLVGNPLIVVILQNGQILLENLTVGLVIALIMPLKSPGTQSGAID